MMNLHKGFKRLTLILSLFVGPIVCSCLGGFDDPEWLFVILNLLVCWVIGFAGVWAIYALVAFVVNGFLDVKVERKAKKPKDE